jgi:membrane protein implicated in regulation of membrane protease activity
MTWELFYLGCFVFGFALTIVSFLAGVFDLHFPAKWHLPHGVGHAGAPHLHVETGQMHAGHGHPGAAHDLADHGSGSISPFNFATIMAFIAWFGGAGYLMTRFYGTWLLISLAVALASGLAGASVVFWFLARVLLSHEQNLDPSDYEVIGLLGKVSSSIRPGGTGEIVFVRGGTRQTSGARSDDGAAIPKGEEVMITRYDRGIAYVRRWEEVRG